MAGAVGQVVVVDAETRRVLGEAQPLLTGTQSLVGLDQLAGAFLDAALQLVVQLEQLLLGPPPFDYFG